MNTAKILVDAMLEGGPDDINPEKNLRDLPEPFLGKLIIRFGDKVAEPIVVDATRFLDAQLPETLRKYRQFARNRPHWTVVIGYHPGNSGNRENWEPLQAELDTLFQKYPDADGTPQLMLDGDTLAAWIETNKPEILAEAGPDDINPNKEIEKLPDRPPRMAYAFLPTDEADTHSPTISPIIVKEGETGYWKTNWNWNRQHAQQALDQMNQRLGLTPEEAEMLFIQSMFKRPAKKKRVSENDEPDRFDPKSEVMRLPDFPKRIAITFSTITPESAENGDTADSGWIDEDGKVMEPDEIDVAEGVTAVDNAVKFLQSEGATEESGADWYSTGYQTSDYGTGEEEERNYHLIGFSPEEEAEIHERMFPRRQPREF